MVDVVLAVFKAEAQGVRAPLPAHIAVGNVLIIAEQKRVGYVRVAEVGKGVEDESGKSGLQRVATVGAGDFQNVQPIHDDEYRQRSTRAASRGRVRVTGLSFGCIQEERDTT